MKVFGIESICVWIFKPAHIVVSPMTYLLQLCIQNNPEEARQMLLQNPQLSYALLQAQVVMKIVSPEIAQVGIKEKHDNS